jgi:hypothetical protein
MLPLDDDELLEGVEAVDEVDELVDEEFGDAGA